MKNLQFCFSLLVVLVASSFTLPSIHTNVSPVATTASADYFLHIDGIKGESKEDGHKEWIELISAKLNPRAKTIAIVRYSTPISSPILKRLSETRTLLKEVIIDQTDGTAYKLKDVYVTSYQTSSSSGKPSESFALNFEEIK